MKIERIEDPSDPRIVDYRDLKNAELRVHQGVFIAEGREIVRRLLQCGRFRTRSVLLTELALDALRALLDRPDVSPRVYLTSQEIVRTVVGYDFHRGCVAAGERGVEPPARALVEPPGTRLLLVLEGVSNPDNVGGVFRNAMVLGADGVLVSDGCTDPLYRKSIRVSAGGSFCVPFARLGDWREGLRGLREAGYTLVALTPRPTAIDIAELGSLQLAPERVALLLGAEGAGLRDETLAATDLRVRIPMAPGADSLNVATASGIALHRLRAAMTGRA